MKHKYTVHSAHVQPHLTKAKLEDGSVVDVAVDAFEVQLVPVGHNGGTIKLFITGKEVADAKSMFVMDKIISATFEGE